MNKKIGSIENVEVWASSAGVETHVTCQDGAGFLLTVKPKEARVLKELFALAADDAEAMARRAARVRRKKKEA